MFTVHCHFTFTDSWKSVYTSTRRKKQNRPIPHRIVSLKYFFHPDLYGFGPCGQAVIRKLFSELELRLRYCKVSELLLGSAHFEVNARFYKLLWVFFCVGCYNIMLGLILHLPFMINGFLFFLSPLNLIKDIHTFNYIINNSLCTFCIDHRSFQ